MKDKIAQYVSLLNIPAIAFAAYVSRIVFYGADISDAVAIFAVAGVFGLHKFLYRKNNLWDKAVENEIHTMKRQIESLNHKTQAKVMYEKKDQPKIRRF